MTQTQMGELLERATAELTPSTDLVTGAVTAGRRRHRRGLALAGAGAFAVAAVVGGAVVLAPGSGSGHDGSLVADQSGASAARSGPSGAPSYGALPPLGTRSATDDGADPTLPGALPPLDGPFPVAADSMSSTLASLLHGTVTNPDDDQYHHPGAPDAWQSGAVDLEGATVSVSFEHSTGGRCDGDQRRGNTGCSDLGGGFFLSTYTAEITTAGEGRTGVRDVGVTYYTPDGYKLNVTASNAGSADPTHPSMDQPVLDIGALTTIAENDVWR